ncbi:NYN domain-containing protein [Aminobacter sp. HY435]|uniref:NYN domain-containing protein n=1 Tax=Aminobacter sp. HY435 TaxID=2970917 RepID=UPI0022B98D8B|nr:NYN domain-containing protein [Aminobacter sp. HY435]
MTNASIALLIDAENLPARQAPAILAHAQSLGRVLVRKVFGDFSAGRLASWTEQCRSNVLEPVFQLSSGKGKNSTDMAMTIQAMDLLHEGKVDVFCVASSDRDFLPLVHRLLGAGKKVYGIGEAKTGSTLKGAYTGFFELRIERHDKEPSSPAVAPGSGGPGPSEKTHERLLCVMDKIELTPASGGWFALSPLSNALRRADPALAATFCGSGKFLRNIKASGLFEEKGTGATMQIRVRPNVVKRQQRAAHQ